MKVHRWIIAIGFIAITVFTLGFIKFQQIDEAMDMAASFPEPSATVNTAVTKVSENKQTYQVTGQAVAPQVITIQNELAGTIAKVNFKGGELVKKGQLLLALNTFEEQAQLVAAKARLKLAKITFERFQDLVQEKKISQQEFDTAEADFSVAKSDKVNIESIINKKQLFASFDGKVGLETYQVGQFLPANSKITKLVGNSPEMWIDFQLSQTKSRLAVGDTVSIQTINESIHKAYKTASIIAVTRYVQAQSRHLGYRAQLDEGQPWLNHNEIVKVTISKAAQPAILVSRAAVNRNHSGAYVFELIKDKDQQYRAKKLTVELGERIGDQQVILSGLQSNVLIATEGSFKLREGLLVYSSSLLKSEQAASSLAGALN